MCAHINGCENYSLNDTSTLYFRAMLELNTCLQSTSIIRKDQQVYCSTVIVTMELTVHIVYVVRNLLHDFIN